MVCVVSFFTPPAFVAWRAGTSNWIVRQAANRFLGSLKGVYKFGLCCLSLPLYICSSVVHTYLKAGCSLSSTGERGRRGEDKVAGHFGNWNL
jgi:hypothetical protein